jgi:tRNA(fMet)-specific endonuclease VapC
VVQTLAPFHSFPFDDDAAATYAQIRHALETAGQTIGPYDLQIAAIARFYDLTLVTSNTQEFGRVAGLKIEDWHSVS